MNKPTEIIYVDETIYNELPPSEASGMKKGEWRELAIMHYRTAYILKSKYDELSLENARLGADLAKLRQQYLDKVQFMNDAADISRNNILQLHIENTKLKAELEKVKHENYILSTPISQEPLLCFNRRRTNHKPIKTPEKK